MQALTVVKDFNIFEYCNFGFVASFEIAMMNQFNFQGIEKLSATASTLLCRVTKAESCKSAKIIG
jgi:hypothetical protein